MFSLCLEAKDWAQPKLWWMCNEAHACMLEGIAMRKHLAAFFLCLVLPPDTTLEESDNQQVLVMEVYSTLTIAKLIWNKILDTSEKIHRTSSKIYVYNSTRWADTKDNQWHIRLVHIITSLLLMISSCWGGLKALIILQCFYNLHLY